MPYCPNCGEEYDEGMSACAVCGSDLVDAQGDREGSEDLENFEAVFIGPLPRALVLRSLLESEGIVVSLQGDEEPHVPSSFADASPGPVKLFVPSESAETALEIVDSAGSMEDPVPACGDGDPESGEGAGDPFASLLPGDAGAGEAGARSDAAPVVPGKTPAPPPGRKPAGGSRKAPAKAAGRLRKAAKDKAKADRPGKKRVAPARARKPRA